MPKILPEQMLREDASRNGLTLHNLGRLCVYVCVGVTSLCIPGMWFKPLAGRLHDRAPLFYERDNLSFVRTLKHPSSEKHTHTHMLVHKNRKMHMLGCF